MVPLRQFQCAGMGNLAFCLLVLLFRLFAGSFSGIDHMFECVLVRLASFGVTNKFVRLDPRFGLLLNVLIAGVHEIIIMFL